MNAHGQPNSSRRLRIVWGTGTGKPNGFSGRVVRGRVAGRQFVKLENPQVYAGMSKITKNMNRVDFLVRNGW
jgi:hypothetical protein